jgi:hypothetical protein
MGVMWLLVPVKVNSRCILIIEPSAGVQWVSGDSVVFDGQPSLGTNNNVSNLGIYLRTLVAITKFDYRLCRFPPQTLYNVSIGEISFILLMGTSYAWVQVPSSTVMAPGMGHIIRGPEPQTGSLFTPPLQASLILFWCS